MKSNKNQIINGSKLPKMWIGFLLAVISSIMGVIDVSKDEYGVHYQSWSLIFILATILYHFYCIYQQHKVIMIITKGKHKITPGKAFWYHFIPIFDLYWAFKWPSEIAKSIGRTVPYIKMSSFIYGTVLLGSAIILAFIPEVRIVNGRLNGILLFPYVLPIISYYINNKLACAFSCLPENKTA